MTKNNDDFLDDELEEGATPSMELRLAWAGWLAALTGLFSFLPITLILGKCQFDFQPLRPQLILYFGAVWLGVHAILVRPVASWVYPQFSVKMKSKGSEARRFLLVLALLTPPLLSFISFRGGLSSLMDLHEALLIAVPPVVIGQLLFERSNRVLLFSSFLAVAIFIPLFVINDILSPVETQISYLSQSGSFYLWRTLLPVLVTLGALVLSRKRSGPLTDKVSDIPDSVQNFSVLCFALGIYGLSTEVLMPIVYALGKGESMRAVLKPEVWWIGFLLSSFFLKYHSRIGYWCLFAFVGINLGLGIFSVGRYLLAPNVTPMGLWWFSTQMLVLALSLWLALFLRKHDTKIYLLRNKS